MYCARHFLVPARSVACGRRGTMPVTQPLWKLLVDMNPQQLLSCIDFRYITDALTEKEALEMIQNGKQGQDTREEYMMKNGYPAYTTSCAWLGYSDQQLEKLCTEALKDGWTRFKVKVGADKEDDKRRCKLIRHMIGADNQLMLDANQRWDVHEAIDWVSTLAEFNPLWIEEPTSPDDILEMIQNGKQGQDTREEYMMKNGYPAYTTSCAWLGYSDQQLEKLCTEALKDGWTRFKVKVGADKEDDKRRCKLIRHMIGADNQLMLDANQRWDVHEAIDWVSTLAEFNPLWIEEPTSPDDILGHATISKALAPLRIGVATGEQCHNRVMFKQFLQAKALQYLQIDSCRLGSVNENLSVLLMAKKFNIPVCPHAGGVGLCELVQHLIIFDYISISGSLENRMCEYVDHLHEHFKYPVTMNRAAYMPPQSPGYSTEMKEASVTQYQFPNGDVWQQLILEKKLEI